MEKKSLNTNLRKAAEAKNDEFYTQLVDIEKELKHYKAQFRDKVVYCNCDDPFESNFFKYFAANFNALGLKKLIATSYKPSPIANTELILQRSLLPGYEDKVVRHPAKLKGRPKVTANKFIINEVGDINNDGAFDLSDIAEQLKANKNNEWAPLEGEGDFRGPESLELLKQADIVVTNPPFSLFREYVAQLVEYDKKFLIIGNKNAFSFKEVFKFISEDKIWTGFSSPGQFLTPGGMLTKKVQGLTRWFTNLEVEKRYEYLTLYKKYSLSEYPWYANYDAIDVSKVTDIPIDYDGEMGVPITFFDKYNPEQFEIIGSSLFLANPMKKIAPKGSFVQGGPRFYLKNSNGTYRRLYDRFVIKKRK